MINFLKFTWLYILISSFVIGVGIISMMLWGFRVSIDFTGGTNLQYRLSKSVEPNEIKIVFVKNHVEIVNFNLTGQTLTARTKALDQNQETTLRNDLQKSFGITVQVQKVETVGPVLGKETMVKTAIASAIAILAILIYMSFAFRGFDFALSAILAMIHDFLVVVGTYALFSHFLGAELDTLFVTAVLTSMSFSVHDTIIIFDKIREYRRLEGISSIEHSANKALTETLVRSLNNSMTIIFMLLALTLLGGSSIRFFVATLLVGTITGTYSSPFIATPILVWLEKRKKQ